MANGGFKFEVQRRHVMRQYGEQAASRCNRSVTVPGALATALHSQVIRDQALTGPLTHCDMADCSGTEPERQGWLSAVANAPGTVIERFQSWCPLLPPTVPSILYPCCTSKLNSRRLSAEARRRERAEKGIKQGESVS